MRLFFSLIAFAILSLILNLSTIEAFNMTEAQKLEEKILPYCAAKIDIPAFNITCWEIYGGPVD